jgi:hypothetical protein
MSIMKKIFLTFGFAGILAIQSLSQSKVENDPQYSVYNYKHPNKAAYAKKHNLDNTNSASQIDVVQSDNYKQSNRKVASRKFGVISKNDKNKPYPNYKHQGRN